MPARDGGAGRTALGHPLTSAYLSDVDLDVQVGTTLALARVGPLVRERGPVVASGSHHELLGRDASYARHQASRPA
ncbi:hypothetical protein [Streptomyces sp. NPDC085466]|uniref:hypothetical protein n=1 Tax=Streptomyces sp. NPDC085466 TaxID=3365725 RepID=UPI0037CF2AD4